MRHLSSKKPPEEQVVRTLVMFFNNKSKTFKKHKISQCIKST